MSRTDPDEIGGYFELELPARQGHFHDTALRFNSGRSCLAYLLLHDHVNKIYLPYFSCAVLVEPLELHKVEYEYYRLDKDFEITNPPALKPGEKLLYINYFGLKSNYILKLEDHYKSSLIIDNVQSFFSPRNPGRAAFYSPRKFFGVPDGGYLVGEFAEDEFSAEIQDHQAEYSHLIGRIEHGAQAYFDAYRKNEESFSYEGIRRMSRLSERILLSVDYKRVRAIREVNFRFLHGVLKEYNNLDIQNTPIPGPFCYPLWRASENLRSKLIENLIFVPTLWKEVLDRLPNPGFIENSFVREILPLPVDQRYSQIEMQKIVDIVKREL